MCLFDCFVSVHRSPSDMGLLDPATSDGRVIFFLPWEGEPKFFAVMEKFDQFAVELTLAVILLLFFVMLQERR